MRAGIKELFEYLNNRDIERFRQNLTTELANTPKVNLIQSVDYVNFSGTIRSEKQFNFLLYEAIREKYYEAVQCLLDKNVDLLQIEKIEGVYYECKPDYTKVPHPYTDTTQTALTEISKLHDPILLQMVFDHICVQGLYKEAVYLQFLIENIDKVSLEKFSVDFLQIDINKPVPERFATGDEFKQFLLELNIDLSGTFFSKSDYFEHLLDPNKTTSKKLLMHALLVSNFDNNELKQIYDSLASEELKQCVVEFCPELDDGYVADLLAMCQAQEEKRLQSTPKRPPSPKPPIVSQHFLADLKHLPKRMPVLKETILRLKAVKKPTAKDKKELDQAKASLADCLQRLKDNPYREEDKDYDEGAYKRLCK